MTEYSHSSEPSDIAHKDELAPEQDTIELIESEMDILRQRMKRLESRMEKLTRKPKPTPLTGAIGKEAPSSSYPSTRGSIPPAPATNQDSSSSSRRRHTKKNVHSDTKRSTKPRRKERSGKVKRKLLRGYGVFLGLGAASVFVIMVMNLFGSDRSGSSSSPEVEIEIERSPLEELRMSIQGSDE